jgi:hypothetical protein
MLIDGTIQMSGIDADKLPAGLEDLPADQRQTELQRRIEERKRLLAEIDVLLKKRAEHVEQERQRLAAAGQTDSFDASVKQIIRTQAAAMGIGYGN